MKRHAGPEQQRPACGPEGRTPTVSTQDRPLIGALSAPGDGTGITGCPPSASVPPVVVAGARQAEQGGRAVLVVRRGHDDRLHAVAELVRDTGVDALREVLVVPVLRIGGVVEELSPDLRRDAGAEHVLEPAAAVRIVQLDLVVLAADPDGHGQLRDATDEPAVAGAGVLVLAVAVLPGTGLGDALPATIQVAAVGLHDLRH